MSTETRKLPDSNVKRNKALTAAKEKNDTPGFITYLSDDTVALLNLNQPLYKTASDDVASETAIKIGTTENLNGSAAALKRVCSRFILVLKLGVEDADFPISSFAYYHLEKSGDLPKMDSYDEIKTVAANLISGEAKRVLAGGTPMTNPAIAKVVTKNGFFLSDYSAQNTAITNLTIAEDALNALNEAADKAILFVYNEVETHFSDKSNSAIRVQGRLWGIPYVKVGGVKRVTIKVVDSITGKGIDDVEVQFENGNLSSLTDADGNCELNTTLMDVQKLIAERALYITLEQNVTLVEGENPTVTMVMVAVVV